MPPTVMPIPTRLPADDEAPEIDWGAHDAEPPTTVAASLPLSPYLPSPDPDRPPGVLRRFLRRNEMPPPPVMPIPAALPTEDEAPEIDWGEEDPDLPSRELVARADASPVDWLGPEPVPVLAPRPGEVDSSIAWTQVEADAAWTRAEPLHPSALAASLTAAREAEIAALAEAEAEREAAPGMLRSNLLVASGTLLSRITGLLRTMLLFAAVAKTLRDAYLLANNTPNIIYELILGGVLTATLVPLFTEFAAKEDDESTSAVVSASIVALLGLTVIAFVATPALVALYASNTPSDVSRSEFLSVGLRLALLFAPQVFFYGLMAVGSALLNSRRRFFAAAWAPVLNNVVVIVILATVGQVGLVPGLPEVQSSPLLLLLLGLGTTAGIVTMTVALLPALRRAGVSIDFKFQPRHPAVRRALALSGWTFGYVIANQVAGQVVNVLTEPGSGGSSAYQLAFQFFQLPHGLLAVSLMTTYQPELARARTLDDIWAFGDKLLQALRVLGLVMIPAAVAYAVIPQTTLAAAARVDPDATVFSLSDRFLRLGDVAQISQILAAFAVGLLGFSVYLFVMRAFYALGDTRTPFYLNCVENAINIVAALILVERYGIVGLALAYAVAYTAGAVLSLIVLIRRLEYFDWFGLVTSYLRLLVAGGVMAAVVIVVGAGFREPDGATLLMGAVLSGLAGLIVYPVAVVVVRVPGADQVVARLRRRRPRPGAPAA